MDTESKSWFLLQDKVWSYSAVNAFATCPYQFKLNYMNREKSVSNFYAEFGLASHEVLEAYWKEEIEIFEMLAAFKKNCNDMLVTPPPPYPIGMRDKFIENVERYFSNFNIEMSDIEVLHVETEIESEYDGWRLTARPDIIYRDKDGKVVLLDYKSSNPFYKSGSPNKKKMFPYERQLLFYSYFVEKELDLTVDEIRISFVRLDGREHVVEKKQDAVDEALMWFTSTLNKMKKEEEFKPNVNAYFCSQICGQRLNCEHWKKKNDEIE